MKTRYSKKIEYIFFLVIGIPIALVNSLLFDNKYLGILLVALEIGVLLYTMFRHSYSKFIGYYILFMATCIEFEQYVGDVIFYNIKSMRFCGINLGIYALLPMLVWGGIHIVKDKLFKKGYPQLWNIALWLIGVNIVAALVGLFCILINDNNIKGMEGCFGQYIGEAYEMIFLPLALFLAFFMAIKYDNQNNYFIEIALQVTLVCIALQVIIPAVFGVFGVYGGTTGLITPTTGVFVPLMLLLPFSKKCYFPKVTFLIALTAQIFGLKYGASGKTIIVTVIVVCISIILMLRSRKKLYKISALVILIASAIVTPTLINSLSSSNVLFKSKIYQVQALFSFGDGWLQKMPVSPKVRVGEYINIITEYIRKPWFILTGKGFLGSIRDYADLFVSREISIDAFSDEQWDNGTFYAMHEMAQMLLTYGILGVGIVIKVIKNGLKEYKNCIWCIFGVYWFVLYYGYSMTLSTYGIVAFFIAFYYLDERDKRLNLQEL